MLFNPSAIRNKKQYLDRIFLHSDLLEQVVRSLVTGASCKLSLLPRTWEPGGGATLYAVTTSDRKLFLKVKDLRVALESRLEGESSFQNISSIRNEYELLQSLSPLSPHLPKVFGYCEEEEFGFLLLEHLEPWKSVLPHLSVDAIIQAYHSILETARWLYSQHLVHTDIHEYNIMFRGLVPVLVDFEEARFLFQPEAFEQSLDVVGETSLGNVGLVPDEARSVPGFTCLMRLKQVLKDMLRERLPAMLAQCNFDSCCPFLNSLDHGKDERIYQSIELPGLSIEGQRPLHDDRAAMILDIISKEFDHPVTHLDIGCNLGRFGLELSKSELIAESIGIEAFANYVELAKTLAFLSDCDKAHFFCAEAGSDDIFTLTGQKKIDCVTIFSVYHHIRQKDSFLADIHKFDPRLIIFEMPVQPECYEGRAWQEEMVLICSKLGNYTWRLVGQSKDYQRPIIIATRQYQLHCDISISNKTSEQELRTPKISIVLPTYNHLRFLPVALESILQQTWRDFELIIVNDGSTDGTREYLDHLSDPRIRIIHQENSRLPKALNTGFSSAKGQLLTWVSSDNYCAPHFLETFVTTFSEHPEAGFAYSAFAWIDENDRIIGIHQNQDVHWANMMKANPGIASFMYRRECHETLGWYDPALEGAEDWDMWLRIIEKYPTIYTPEITCYYRLHANSMTEKMPEQILGAVRHTFANAVKRHGSVLQIDQVYRGLSHDKNPELSKYAHLDLASHLLQSPYFDKAYAGLAEQALRAVFSMGNVPWLGYHLLCIYFIKTYDWKRALTSIFDLQRVGGQELEGVCLEMKSICLPRDFTRINTLVVPGVGEDIQRKLHRNGKIL